MKTSLLPMKRTLCAALIVLLLNVVEMTNVNAQTPYRQYSDNGILLNFHEIDNVDFRVFLLYNLSQDDQFILTENEESGQFSIIANDEMEVTDLYDVFETFYNNVYTDFCLLSKIDIDDLIYAWKSEVAPQHFTSIMMDVSLRRTRSGDNDQCINAIQICTSEVTEYYAASTDQTAQEENMDDGCIGSSYNPSWYCLKIADPGQFVIHIEGHDPNNPSTLRDIDFCLWGPYTEEQVNNGYACTHLTGDKIIDCNYSTSYTENVFLGYPEGEHVHSASHGTVNYHVPQMGECYFLMITNYSRQPCVVTFTKEEGSGSGTADCNLFPPIVSNDGPYCVGETIHLYANSNVSGCSYSWTGPNNYSSRFQNPTRMNCTMLMTGAYICTISRSGYTGTACDTTWVEVYPQPYASFTTSSTTVCVGNSIDFTSTSTTNPTGYTIPICNWDFGDGQTASGTSVSHIFDAVGTYAVTLSVATEGGYCTDEITQTIYVSEGEEIFYDPVYVCQPYTWAEGNGQTYSEPGTYIGVFETETETGCPRIEYITITISDVVNEEVYQTECDSYTWIDGDGQTYNYSGDFEWNTTTVDGCPKTVTLHLTLNHSEWYEFTVTASDSYIWHGQTYTQSGTYTYETTTAEGCPRTEILHLTIDGNHWTPVADGQYPFAMTLYGVISIDGMEQTNNQLELGVFCGNECRGTAMVSEFFLTHRYLAEVNVYGDSGEQLTFKLYDHATHQELDLTPPAPITFTIDGYGNPVNPYVLNFTSSVNIAATTAPEGAGTVTGTGEYTIGSTCTLTATANTGFQFLNWTLNGSVVSTSPNYSFTVTGAANYVAHFQYVQSRTLVSGWNWWSTYIEQNGSNGLEMLENSLGTSGIRIQGKNNSVDYFEYQGTGYWYGSLNTLTNEHMYMIRTSAACDAVIVGDATLPSNHPITINGGWNWIGYPCSQSVSVDAAMAGFSPEPNDVIKGRSSASMYLSYNGYQGWYGQLNTLEPGEGYMYRSYSNATKTLRFQTGRGGETPANITPESNVFVPNTANYADNMIVTAVIDMEGAELRSDDYELAAFAGNECRGSVKLMYVEPFDRYVALLMAFGEGEEELRFVLTDGNGTSWSNDRMTYVANGTVGTMTEPEVLHFGPLGVEDNTQKIVNVYPNPSNGVFNIEGEGIRKIEVIDVYGQVILSKEVKTSNIQVDLGDKAVGAYLLRVITDDGIATHKLVKNN